MLWFPRWHALCNFKVKLIGIKCFASEKSYRKWWYVGPLCPYWWTGTVFLCKIPVIVTPVYLTSLDMVGQMHADWNIWWTHRENPRHGTSSRPGGIQQGPMPIYWVFKHWTSITRLHQNKKTTTLTIDITWIFWLVVSMIPLHTFPSQLCEVDLCKKACFLQCHAWPDIHTNLALQRYFQKFKASIFYRRSSMAIHGIRLICNPSDGWWISIPARMAIVIRFFSIRKLRNGRSFTRSGKKLMKCLAQFSRHFEERPKGHPQIFNNFCEPINPWVCLMLFFWILDSEIASPKA